MSKLPKSAEARATVYITKLAAAQRQLNAAIRLFFVREDELAIHTIAHAAYRLLADLKTTRGREEAEDVYAAAIFYSVRSFHRGALPDYISQNPDAMKWIRNLADCLPITADSKLEEVRMSLKSDAVRKFWKEVNRIPNFLKHADRDSATHVSLGEVDNGRLIMQAVSAYRDVTGNFSPEGRIFWLYSCVEAGEKIENLSSTDTSVMSRLGLLSPRKRMDLCSQWVRDLR